MSTGAFHRPVMLKEVLEWLRPVPGNVIVDCTVGAGGHALALLKGMLPGGLLIGIDRDKEALMIARENLRSFEGSFKLFHANYSELDCVLGEAGVDRVNGVLLDLGVSSMQLEAPERGFSLYREGPLDMRMDRAAGITARELLERTSEKDLEDLFRTFGEERWARRIARTIKQELRRGVISTTTGLSSLVGQSVPRAGRIHPATRVFQALRIAVNKELEALEKLLGYVHECLVAGSRLAVISFHSLEDRLVKNAFRDGAKKGFYKILTTKPQRPEEEEVRQNPRSRSARLRVVERLSKQ